MRLLGVDVSQHMLWQYREGEGVWKRRVGRRQDKLYRLIINLLHTDILPAGTDRCTCGWIFDQLHRKYYVVGSESAPVVPQYIWPQCDTVSFAIF